MSSAGQKQRRRFSTGNEHLDRRLDGGLPPGELLALTAPPASQSQLLLREMAGSRPSLYVSTTGVPEAELRERFVDGEETEVRSLTPETVLGAPEEFAEAVDPESYVVVDASNPLEQAADRAAYREFLNALTARLRAVDSVGVLHCLVDHPPPARRTDTLHRADHVRQLYPEYGARTLGYRLLVTKSRGHRAAEEPLPLVLTDEVDVDTSRSI